MEGVSCVRCGADDSNYLDVTRRLAVCKKCRHIMCRGCLQLTFGSLAGAGGRRGVTGPVRSVHTTAKCPVVGCGTTITLADFSDKLPEQEEFEREVEIRRRVTGIYNKTLAEFGGDDKAYNDYLERVEWLIAALLTGSPLEAEAADAEITAYRASNQSTIAFNAARHGAAMRQAEERLVADKHARAAAAVKTAVDEVTHQRRAHAAREHLLEAIRSEGLTEEQRGELKLRLLDMLDEAHRREAASGEGGVGGDGGGALGSIVPDTMFVPMPTVFPPAPLPSSAVGPGRPVGGAGDDGHGVDMDLAVALAGGLKLEQQWGWLREEVDDALFILPPGPLGGGAA